MLHHLNETSRLFQICCHILVSVSLENWEYIIAEGFFLELQELNPKSNLQ